MTQHDDAITEHELNDVSADEQQTAGDTPPEERAGEPREMTERERRMAELVKERYEHEGIDYEPASEGETEEGEQDTAGQDASGDDSQDDEPAARDPLEELGYYRKPDGKLYTTMKINGEEREVSAEQVKTYLQKDLAGDYKLQQAAERERQLQEIERQLRQRDEQLQQSLSRQNQPPAKGAEEIRQQAKAVLQKVWDGDDDAAADALAEFIRGNSQAMDTDQLLTQAEQRAMTAMERREAEKQQRAWQQSVEEGNRWLASQQPEIYRDSRLFDLVNGETERLVQAQQNGDPELANLTPREIIERAALDVRGWMDGRQDKPEGKQENGRAERKAGLKPMPRGLAKQPTRQQKQEVDNSPAAVVARMRQARAVN
ncbi:hypothetical protein [uncultured Halomonas sp.]|uniref:hypothetical protein n=1 Tax=uncultured Halomonas sp. TaxID=173971 RepID=UPI00261CDA60|nr:hypothetical protein [uncultured Halomonas sp.]